MADLPLVLQLQRDAADEGVAVSTLLRKAKMAAVKLDVPDLLEWIDHELNGYDDVPVDEYPSYRLVHGEPKVWNPYHGWQPIIFRDPKTFEFYSSCPAQQSAGSLEELLRGHEGQGLLVNYDVRRKNALIKSMEIALDPAIHITAGQVWAIVDAVRNTILNWALELEKKGILGEGQAFSASEKSQAQPLTQQFFGNTSIGFAGAAHDHARVTASQTNQGIDAAALLNLLQQARGVADMLPEDCRNEAKTLVEQIEAEAKAPQSDPGKLRGLLVSLRTTLEGAAGNIVAQGMIGLIGKVLGA